MGSPRPHTRRPRPGRTRAALALMERRADHILDVWRARPSVGYGEMTELVMDRFDVGIVAAQKAIALAYQRLEAQRPENDASAADRVADFYLQLAEEARRRGAFNSARLAMDSYRATRGIGSDVRIEVTHRTPAARDEMADLSTEELELLAKIDRRRAEVESAEAESPATEH